MTRGFFIAGTGMMLQRRNMEVITSNITNADTVGYKKDILTSRTFNDVLLERINDTAVVGQTRQVGPLNWGTRVDQLYVDYQIGNFEESGNPTDIALAGDAFFALNTPQGERYTRAGNFVVNAQGYLTNPDGHAVLGQNGPVYVGGRDFSVDSLGNIAIDGTVTDRLRLVTFGDNAGLRKQGDNLYFSTGGQPQVAGIGEVEVLQGFTENSNVDIGREMVDMITVYRTYETNQRMLTMIDETVGKAVNEIGRLR